MKKFSSNKHSCDYIIATYSYILKFCNEEMLSEILLDDETLERAWSLINDFSEENKQAFQDSYSR